MVRRRLDPSLAVRIDPDDILAEAFLRARKRWPRFLAEGKMRSYPWLYRIVLDCLSDAWRRATRDRRDVRADLPWPEESSIQLGLGLVATGSSPSEAAAREELRHQMNHVLELLREKDREILWMRHHDGLTHAEIADLLGLTENAVGVRYVRALERLRQLWQRLHPDSELRP
jgi:RNA polymerase sigma-70 factor (ECF subfamily)